MPPCADFIVGFQEMWQPVHAKYQPFFECSAQLAAIVTEITKAPVGGPLLQIVGRMAASAANTNGALLLLVLNGYGHDAMRLARSLFEIEVNIAWLQLCPEDIDDFMQYRHIQQKQRYDLFTDEQKAVFAKERYDEMMAAYDAALPRFATKRDPTRPRNEWCRVSLYERARDVGKGRVDLYRTFYAQASSMHHLDFSGLAAAAAEDQLADSAPSWNHLDTALSAIGCAYRCVLLYDELGNLGFKQRLEEGPGAVFVAACKAIAAA
jgi:Family of unknown function (DUF5677)